ncbi:MAG: acyl-CoA dehydrogenase family protein [Caldilineales bacterium]|nr:acyl-CoA dehydrogenase family protein [Caldilineales bacterium]
MYSFDLTDEQRMLTEAVNRYATRTVRKTFREAEEAKQLPPEVIRTGWELGLLPASIPEKLGGFGEHSAVNGALYAEELGYGDVATALHLLSPNLVAVPILLCGAEAQKEEYLPLFCGEEFPKVAAAFVEPSILFDPSEMSSSARLQGDEYILFGHKTMVINADEAELLLVYAREGHTGSTQAFLVPNHNPGVGINRRDQRMGFHAPKTHSVEFTGVHIPKENKLGGESGIDLQLILSYRRIALGALAIVLAKGAYEYARDYAKERHAFGEPIAYRQSIAFMLANMAIEIDATRLLVWEAAWKIDKGENATHDAYLAARYASEMALKVTDNAVQVLGGHGYIREYPVELWLRNGRGIATLLGAAIV